MAHPRVLERERSVLVVIDVQEGYRGKTAHHDRMVRGVQTLVRAAHAVGVPILATEQYPKGIGHLLPEVTEHLGPAVPVIEKLSLSCWGARAFVEALRRLERRQVVVCGIEAHACVNQTVHDLLECDYAVHLPVDAISARFEHDFRVGIDKMCGSGAVPSTVEMVCLEWVRTAAAPEFKAIHRMIK
ncbi:isochorismatase family protein [Candidatus Binatia bacterium]|nr:isochorismatase family protein [Candidatus Binatia bacterium]